MSELLLQSPELLPEHCVECPPADQRFYFRSFTQKSYDSFTSSNSYRIPFSVLNFDNLSVTPKASLDYPGTFWSSADPLYSYALGFARGIVEQQPVYFMAINYCSHHAQNGIYPYEVVGIPSKNPSVYIVEKVDPTTDQRDNLASSGTVFPSLAQDQLDKAKWYQIPQRYLNEEQPRRSNLNPPDIHAETLRVFRNYYVSQNERYRHDPQLFMSDMVNSNKLLTYTR